MFDGREVGEGASDSQHPVDWNETCTPAPFCSWGCFSDSAFEYYHPMTLCFPSSRRHVAFRLSSESCSNPGITDNYQRGKTPQWQSGPSDVSPEKTAEALTVWSSGLWIKSFTGKPRPGAGPPSLQSKANSITHLHPYMPVIYFNSNQNVPFGPFSQRWGFTNIRHPQKVKQYHISHQLTQ